MITFPMELSLTLITGKCVNVTLTDAYVVSPTFDRDQPKDDYYGYTDIDYTCEEDLSEPEQKDLDKRIRKFIDRLYATQDVEFDV